MQRNLFSATVLAATGIFFAFLHFGLGEPVKEALSASGILIAAFGFCFGAYSLRENHRWNRYSYTLNLLAEWNNQVREHLDVLDSEFSDLRHIPKNRKGWGITADRAQEIAHSTLKASPVEFRLRTSLITVLNHFELLARAYELAAVDKQTVAESFGAIVLDIWEYFAEFVECMRQDVGVEPWPPVKRVCEVWIAERFRDDAERTAKAASAAFEKAKERLKNERQTGG